MDNSLSKEAADWREGRRLRAWELKKEGWSQQRISDALGVSKGAVPDHQQLALYPTHEVLQETHHVFFSLEGPLLL